MLAAVTVERRSWQPPRMPRVEVADAERVRQALRVFLYEADRTEDPESWDTSERFVEWLEREAEETTRPYRILAGRPARRLVATAGSNAGEQPRAAATR